MSEELFAKIEAGRPGVEGWCSAEKSRSLAETILHGEFRRALEIGVFGGSSLLPQAMAFQHLGSGIVYGIDPWTKDAALEEMKEQVHVDWWSKNVDLDEIHRHCLGHVLRLGLEPHCMLIRDKAEHVVDLFEDGSIDLLHIDGNHSEALSYKDAVLYLPKVKIGGVIYFDDVDWREEGAVTTHKAMEHLLAHGCEKIGALADCAILKKVA